MEVSHYHQKTECLFNSLSGMLNILQQVIAQYKYSGISDITIQEEVKAIVEKSRHLKRTTKRKMTKKISITVKKTSTQTLEILEAEYINLLSGLTEVQKKYYNFFCGFDKQFDNYNDWIITQNFHENVFELHGAIGSLKGKLLYNKTVLGNTKNRWNISFSSSIDPDLNDAIRKMFEEPEKCNFVRLYETYSNSFRVNFWYTTHKKIQNICKCGEGMTFWETESEMRCNDTACGLVFPVQGTIFDEYQFYENNQKPSNRPKNHDSDKHCKKWLDIIQARENYKGSADLMKKLDALAVWEYTNAGRLRPMDNMTCDKVIEWLKYLGMTDLKKHAPLFRKLITSNHGKPVVPPQLTELEYENILTEFALDMREFPAVIADPVILKQIGKTEMKNKFYFPHALWNILSQMLKGDSRLSGILECIHLQSDETTVKKDLVLREICLRRGKAHDFTSRDIIN